MMRFFKIFLLLVCFLIIAYFAYDEKDEPEVLNAQEFEQRFGSAVDEFRPVVLEGWDVGWRTREEFDGDNMPDNALVESVNIDMDVKKSIAPRKGSLVLGTESDLTNSVTSLHVSFDLEGRELLLRAHSTTTQWYNTINSEWETLENGFTSGKTFTFANGGASNEENVFTYYANGAEAIRRFPVAFGVVETNTSTAVLLATTTDPELDTAAEHGFSSTGGWVTINSANYQYDSLNGLWLQGMSGLGTFGADDGIIAHATTTGFSDAPTSSVALLVKDQRLFAAWENLVYVSKIDNLRDFTFSSPRVASEGELLFFPNGGGDITGLADLGDFVAVFKEDYIDSVRFADFAENTTDIPVFETISSGPDVGSVNNKGIANQDNNVIYTSDDIGMVLLSRNDDRGINIPQYITEAIRPTMEEHDFSDAATVVWNKKILNASRDSSNVTFNNRITMYDFVTGRLTEFRGWNASSFAVFENNLYFGDSITQNVRQAFYQETYDDDSLPYVTKARTKWYNFGLPANWKEIGWVFVEGWINNNTEIEFTILLDEGGALSSKEVTISGTGSYVASGDNEGVFGPNPFGLHSFSPVSTSNDNLKHFAGWIVTNDLYDKKFRNVAFQIETSGVGQNYRITRIVPYVDVLDVNYSRQNNEDFIISP